MEENGITLKQYITTGFVRTGVSRLGYALTLALLTGSLGYGVWSLHQRNQAIEGFGISILLEYLLLTIVGILLISMLTNLCNGIKSFQHFGYFMRGTEVKLEGVSAAETASLQIGIALDYLTDERIIYENRNAVLTNRHIIILEGDPCIYPMNQIKKVSFDFEELVNGKQPNLAQLKTVVLSLSSGEKRKISCQYIQEAQDISKRLIKQGIKIDSLSSSFLK